MITVNDGLRIVSASLLVVLVAACGEVSDQAATGIDVPRYLEDAGCIECHERSEMRIGPPYDAIALRYAGADARAREILARKIIHGGAGNWGVVPMVPNPQVGLDPSRAIVDWIIGLEGRAR